MASNFFKLKQLIELARETGADEETWFNDALQRYSLTSNEHLYKKLFDFCLSKNTKHLLDNTFRLPSGKDELKAVDGPYKFATIADTNIAYGLHQKSIQMHSLIGGGSGFGKSTLVKILCQQILAEGKIHIIIIDPKGEGGDFRFLARDFNALVLRPDTIRCNPFTAISNVPRDMLRELVCEVTADSFGVYDASEGILAKHAQRIFELYQEPTLHDFIASIQTEKGGFGGRKQGYLDSLDTRLTKAQISLGNIINCKSDYFSKLFNKSVIFEIGELSGSAQRVLVPWLILKIVLFKIKNPTPYLSHLLIFDEAQANIFSRELFENRGRTSFMATLATQCRAFGLGIMVLAQNPSMKLIREVIANSCVKCCFQLGSGEEVLAMARHMGLTPEQTEELYHLDRQEAIFRVGLGYTEPLKLRIYDFQENAVSNEELSEIMTPQWKSLLESVEPATAGPQQQELLLQPKQVRTSDDLKPNPTKPAETPVQKEHIKSEKDSGTNVVSSLSEDEKTYLTTVKRYPYRLVSEVYSLLGDPNLMGTERISQSKAVDLRKKLLKSGYLETLTINGTGKSGRSSCDIPTEKAGMGTPPRIRGDYAHTFWSYRISAYFEQQGATIKMGDTSSGNEIDISVEMDKQRIGAEIVISTLVYENLPKHLKYYDSVLILCIDDAKLDEVMDRVKSLPEDIQQRITIKLLKDYFISL